MGLLIIETDYVVHLVVVARPEIIKENLDGLLGADCWVHQAFGNRGHAYEVAESWNRQYATADEMAGVLTMNLCELAR